VLTESEQPVEGARGIDVLDVGRGDLTIDRTRTIMSTPYAACRDGGYKPPAATANR
jgi:hypothetical protein